MSSITNISHWVCLRIGLTASFSLWQNTRELRTLVDKALCIHAFYTTSSDYQKFQFKGNVITFTLIKSHWSNLILMMSLLERKWMKLTIHPSVFHSWLFSLLACGVKNKNRINWTDGPFSHKSSVLRSELPRRCLKIATVEIAWWICHSFSFINPPKFMPLTTLDQSAICLATPFLCDCSPVTFCQFPKKLTYATMVSCLTPF